MWVVAALNRVVREASSRRCHWAAEKAVRCEGGASVTPGGR